MQRPLRVLLVASEMLPYAKTGGLADVMGALPPALHRRGVDARVCMPRYRRIERHALTAHSQPLGVPLGSGERWCSVLQGEHHGVPVYFIEHDELFDRDQLYGMPGAAFWDNCLRFALLSRGALQLCLHLDWLPDVVHCNDWQAALIPVYLNSVAQGTPLARTASLLTIHNLAYQGQFSKDQWQHLGLDWEHFTVQGLEYYDDINVLKGGINHATTVSTVSPTYAREIQSAAYGEGLEGVLRARGADLVGVLNGIDYEVWDPATDPHIAANFSAADPFEGKAACKAALQQEAGLPLRPDLPLVGMITRLVAQKGLDLMAESMDRLLRETELQLVLLGTGEAWAADFFSQLAQQHPDRVCAWITFDEALAHQIEAGADFFCMPSRYEPCGLNQLYSMRYGTLPIIRATGGLEDTGQNFDEGANSGECFKFRDATADALVRTVKWACWLYLNRPQALAAAVQRAMKRDFSWEGVARKYEQLYRVAMTQRGGALAPHASTSTQKF